MKKKSINTVKVQENYKNSGGIYFHPKHEEKLRSDTEKLFLESSFFTNQNDDKKKEFRLWNGRLGTSDEHMDWLYNFINVQVTSEDGYRKVGGRKDSNNNDNNSSKITTTYEIHDELTTKGDGCGFFRVKARVNAPSDLFLCFMMDAPSMGMADPTFRVLDYSQTDPSSAKEEKSKDNTATTKFCYCRVSPSSFMKNVDFFDLTGYRRDDHGRLYSLAISCDTTSTANNNSCDTTMITTSSSYTTNDETATSTKMLPTHKRCNRAIDMYRGWILTPVNGDKTKTNVTAIYQGNLNSGIPNALTNRMVGNAISTSIRLYEKECQKMIDKGLANVLLKKHGFL